MRHTLDCVTWPGIANGPVAQVVTVRWVHVAEGARDHDAVVEVAPTVTAGAAHGVRAAVGQVVELAMDAAGIAKVYHPVAVDVGCVAGLWRLGLDAVHAIDHEQDILDLDGPAPVHVAVAWACHARQHPAQCITCRSRCRARQSMRRLTGQYRTNPPNQDHGSLCHG